MRVTHKVSHFDRLTLTTVCTSYGVTLALHEDHHFELSCESVKIEKLIGTKHVVRADSNLDLKIECP